MCVQIFQLIRSWILDILGIIPEPEPRTDGETVRCAVARHLGIILLQSVWLACVRIFKIQIASPFSDANARSPSISGQSNIQAVEPLS